MFTKDNLKGTATGTSAAITGLTEDSLYFSVKAKDAAAGNSIHQAIR
jgi:hypothetical protein